jgi:hypothetical protein
MKTTREEILGQIDNLQVWFASRPYGFRETATPEQVKQFEDREREQEYLIARLEAIDAK